MHTNGVAVFTTVQLARLSGNTYKRIEKLIAYGLLVPANATGRRIFSTFALYEAARLRLLMDAGMTAPQLRATSKVIHETIQASVKPEPGYDLFARAAYGFLIETVKGLQTVHGQRDNPEVNVFVTAATRHLKSKAYWRIEHLAAFAIAPPDDVAIVIPDFLPTMPDVDDATTRISALA